jgi:DNA invertase Pin-like site-specific DNA recombinase
MSESCGLYLRVSTDTQDEANQLPDLERRAQLEGWRVARIYRDHGVSGSKARRPELDELLDDARAGKFKVVAAWSASRFGRSLVDSVLAMHELCTLGVRLIFVTQGVDTGTPIGRGVAALLAALAEEELAEKRRRVKAGMQRVIGTRRDGRRGTERTKTGRPIGRPRVPLDPALVHRLRAAGLSLREIVAKMPPWTDGKGNVRHVNRRAVQRALAPAQNPTPETASQGGDTAQPPEAA